MSGSSFAHSVETIPNSGQEIYAFPPVIADEIAELRGTVKQHDEKAADAVSKLVEEVDRVLAKQSCNYIDFKPFDFSSGIPPRQLIEIGGVRSYAKGFLSVTGAAGGTGKSSLAIIEELSLAIGVDLFDKERKPLRCGRQRVWAMSLEDDETEHRRRVIAAMTYYNIDPSMIEGWYFVTYKNDSPITVAAFDKVGGFVVTPQSETIKEIIRANKVDVVTVDPFVNSHACPENDNVVMNKVADIWRSIAQTENVALMLTHHIRKGSGEVVADDLRGAVALVGAARLVRVLAPMTQQEAVNFGIEPERHRFYFWVNPTAKANIVAPADKRSWFHLSSQPLNNGTDEWDQDVLGVVEAWEAPSALEGVTGDHVVGLARVMAVANDEFLITRCRESSQAKGWIGELVGDVMQLDITDPQARAKVKSVVRSWASTNVLKLDNVYCQKQRKKFPCYRLGAAARMTELP